MKRMSLIFRSKANKALDRAEDPRETLDYSYQRQLELLSARYAVGSPTSRPAASAWSCRSSSSSSSRPSSRARPRRPSRVDREDLAREALTRKSGLTTQIQDLAGAARQPPGRGGEARPRPAAAAGEGRVLPHPQGDDQGRLHRSRGADAHRRGDVGHRRGDGRRRPRDPAGRGQDRPDAGPCRRHRRADRLRCARRRVVDQRRRRHRPRARRAQLRPPTSSPSWPGSRPRSTPQAIESGDGDILQDERRAGRSSARSARAARHDRPHPRRGSVRRRRPCPRRAQRARHPDRAPRSSPATRRCSAPPSAGCSPSVRASGTHHDVDTLDESDLILPPRTPPSTRSASCSATTA